jgi:biotin transporter BioY
MYAFCVVIVYSMRSCVLFNVLILYCLLFVYLVVYVTYIVLTLPPGEQPICSSVIIIMMEALRSLLTSVLTRATRSNIPEDGFLHSQPRKSLISHSINWLDTVAET